MALISNVVTGGTIAATWGNAVRDGALQTSTGGTFPSGPAVGTRVLFTDTKRIWIYVGGATAVGTNPAGWIPDGQIDPTGRTGFTVRAVATQSYTSASSANLAFDTKDYDSDGFVPALSASTFTVPTGLGGLYAINFWFSYPTTNTNNTGVVGAIVQTTGTTVYVCYSGDTIGTSATSQPTQNSNYGRTVAQTIPLAAGDTLQFWINQAIGQTASFNGRVTCYRIGA